MRPYDIIIMEMLPGDTPKEKYDNLKKMGELLMITGWARRGTEEENLTKFDIAEKIYLTFSVEQIEKVSNG